MTIAVCSWRSAALLLAAVLNLSSGTALALAADTAFYVSTTGDDSASGTQEQPWRSVQRAQAGIIALKGANGGTLPGNVVVNIASGLYYLSAPLNITGADGGEATYAVTYAGPASGSPAVLSAGAPITGWALSPGTSDVFETTLSSADFPQAFVRQLFALPSAAVGAGARRDVHESPVMIAAFTNQSRLVAQPGQINASSADLTHAFVRMYHNWVSSINRIASYNGTSRVLTPQGVAGDSYFSASGNRYSIQNNLGEGALLQLTPGSFLYNPTSRVVVYRGLPGENPVSGGPTLIIGERLPFAVLFSGTPTAGVVNTHLVNVTIAHASAALEESCISTGCGDQSESSESTAAVWGSYLRRVSLVGVTVANVGQYGIWFQTNAHDILISGCTISGMGAGGVRIGVASGSVGPPDTVTSNVTLSDCVIHDGGHIVQAGCGVLLQQASACTITHNHIHHMRYTGISTGWDWGYMVRIYAIVHCPCLVSGPLSNAKSQSTPHVQIQRASLPLPVLSILPLQVRTAHFAHFPILSPLCSPRLTFGNFSLSSQSLPLLCSPRLTLDTSWASISFTTLAWASLATWAACTSWAFLQAHRSSITCATTWSRMIMGAGATIR